MICSLRTALNLTAISLLASSLVACAHTKPYCPKPNHDYMNTPDAIDTSYTKKNHCIYASKVIINPSVKHKKYTVKGKVMIARYNIWGFKRQQATLDDLLREKTAALGGNAIIKINKTVDSISGTVIFIH